MLYTLGKVFVWFVAAFVLGALVGWIVHHVLRCSSSTHGAKVNKRTQVADVDGPRDIASRAELKELRSRIAALEPAEQERDRLRRDLAELRAARAAERATERAGEQHVVLAAPMQPEAVPDGYDALRADRDGLRHLISRHEATIGVQAATINRLQSHIDSESSSGPPPPDLTAGAALLGRPIKLDDLTLVVGIDRDIAALCHRQEINTWWALANTDVRVLRGILEQAGPNSQHHDPSSWPQQARLLAHGSWQQFVSLARHLPAGR